MDEKLLAELIGKRIDDTKNYISGEIQDVSKDIKELSTDINDIKIANARQDEELKGIHKRMDNFERRLEMHIRDHKCVDIKIKAFFGSKKGKIATLLSLGLGMLMAIIHAGGF